MPSATPEPPLSNGAPPAISHDPLPICGSTPDEEVSMAMFIDYYSHTSDTTSPASFINETNRSTEPRVGASLAHVRTAGARTLRWRYRRICDA